MSTNHRERIERVVDNALKEASLGEPYGFYVCPAGMWSIPQPPSGKMSPPQIAWFIFVSIRATGIGEPDLGRGFPVAGVLPADQDFVFIAQGLLQAMRTERDEANVSAITQAGPSMKLSDRPK